MKKTSGKRITVMLMVAALALSVLAGCGQKEDEPDGPDEDILSENIIITETGEVLEKEMEEENAKPTVSDVPDAASQGETAPTGPEMKADAVPTVNPENITAEADWTEPAQEQVVTDVDQKEPQGHELQLVFLGDSIFDTYRDGSGVPYLTAAQCGADVYNLAIGGTRAAIDADDLADMNNWTSTSLVGVVNAMIKLVPTDCFEGKITKELLDNPNIDYTQTDYFIVEYGMNDFLSASPLDSESGELFNIRTYAGALRYAVSNLQSLAPDATIILCAPNYAQFYNGNWMIGDGNSVNNGYGTLFDYKGICNYVANEYQVLFFNAYQDLGINGYTADEYLEDGIHLTDAGRQLYADALAKMILSYEETKNN